MSIVPVAWTIPRDDTADSNGFIPAMAYENGEFTKPLYAASPPAPSSDMTAKRIFELGALAMRQLAEAKCGNAIESLMEGVMTDAGLTPADKKAMYHQVDAIEEVRSDIHRQSMNDAAYYGSYILPDAEQADIRQIFPEFPGSKPVPTPPAPQAEGEIERKIKMHHATYDTNPETASEFPHGPLIEVDGSLIYFDLYQEELAEEVLAALRSTQAPARTYAGITVKAPFDLRALLAKMKSAKETGIGMAVWDQEIKAIEYAIATIEGIRALATKPAGEEP